MPKCPSCHASWDTPKAAQIAGGFFSITKTMMLSCPSCDVLLGFVPKG